MPIDDATLKHVLAGRARKSRPSVRNAGRVLFYVQVPNVEAALQEAKRLGGKRQMGPEGNPGTLVVGQFTDPDGNLIDVAGTE